MTYQRFEDVPVWQKAAELYELTEDLLENESFRATRGFRDQLDRAALSVSNNIAEGFERNGDREFIQFLTIAKGSCGEVRAQLYIALDQNYIDEKQFIFITGKLIEISRMLSGLMKYLQQSEFKGSKFK